MTALTARLHQALLSAFGSRVLRSSSVGDKPLDINFSDPAPLRLRIYMYSLVGGTGERARREYKIVLRVPNRPSDAYQSFAHADGRFTTVVGYDGDLDVFVLWDATLHPRFKNAGNLQVRDEVVRRAAASGAAHQIRVLTGGIREVVLACQSWNIMAAIEARIAYTGGLGEGECPTFPS